MVPPSGTFCGLCHLAMTGWMAVSPPEKDPPTVRLNATTVLDCGRRTVPLRPVKIEFPANDNDTDLVLLLTRTKAPSSSVTFLPVLTVTIELAAAQMDSATVIAISSPTSLQWFRIRVQRPANVDEFTAMPLFVKADKICTWLQMVATST